MKITLFQARLGIILVVVFHRDIMLGQVRYPRTASLIARGSWVPKYYTLLQLVPDCREPISTRESGTKVLYFVTIGTRLPRAYKHAGVGYQYSQCLRLVPDCCEPISTRESGTKVLILKNINMFLMFIPNLTQLMIGQVRLYRYILTIGRVDYILLQCSYLTLPNIWQARSGLILGSDLQLSLIKVRLGNLVFKVHIFCSS